MEVEIGLGPLQRLKVWLGGLLFIVFVVLFALSVIWSAIANGAWWVLFPIGVAALLVALASRHEWPEREQRPLIRRDRLLETLEAILEARLSE